MVVLIVMLIALGGRAKARLTFFEIKSGCRALRCVRSFTALISGDVMRRNCGESFTLHDQSTRSPTPAAEISELELSWPHGFGVDRLDDPLPSRIGLRLGICRISASAAPLTRGIDEQ